MRIRDFNATETIEVTGVTFEIGCIPSGKYRTICLLAADAIRNSTRRALSKARSDLGDPEFEALAETDRDELILGIRMQDPEYVEAAEAMQREALAWGVRGHSGEGVPAFEGVEREWQGRKYPGASGRMVDLYADDPLVIANLYVAISAKNGLGGEQKKSSSPAAPTTPAGGAASTA